MKLYLRMLMLAGLGFAIRAPAAFGGEAPTENDVKNLLAKMPPTHRVLWPASGKADLERAMRVDPALAFVWEATRAAADSFLQLPPSSESSSAGGCWTNLAPP